MKTDLNLLTNIRELDLILPCSRKLVWSEVLTRPLKSHYDSDMIQATYRSQRDQKIRKKLLGLSCLRDTLT